MLAFGPVRCENLWVAYDYVSSGRDQLFLLATSMRDWLDEGHLAWFVIDVVDRVDTTAFHALHPNHGPGRPAYNPEMMLALLFYAYGTGVRSARRIEASCRTDAAYRVICANATPDHATIARFLVDHEAAIEAVFVDVLRLCAAAGLVSVGTIAIDGTKIGSDAALDANRTSEWIRAEVERILAEAAATDAVEDAQSALFDTGGVGEAMSTRAGRLARLDAAQAEIDAAAEAARVAAEERAAAARAEAAEGRRMPGPKPKEPHAALARAEAELAAAVVRADARAGQRAALEAGAAAEGRKLRGPRPGPDRGMARAQAAVDAARAAVDNAEPVVTQANVTDPQSRIMKTATGWVQGYNAQAAVNENQIVVACTVTQDHNDVGQYQPMVAATLANLAAAGIGEPIGHVLADAGYWSDTNATTTGPARLIATLKDHKQRRAARDLGTTTGDPPEAATPLEAMEHRLRTEEGAALYATRGHTVEPVFSVKENHGYRRFRRRGLNAATSEWALIATSHNLGKLFRSQSKPLGVT